jgi:putative addiction module component (TIGR02574 family)
LLLTHPLVHIAAMATNPLFDYSKLSPTERLELAQDLWDSVDPASDASVLPVTEEQKAELDRRLDELDAVPSSGAPWPDVRKRVLDQLQNEHRHKRGA